jgi:phage-related protein
MRQKMEPGEKPLYWVGASKRDLMAMPAAVIRHIGTALSVAQYGGKHPDAKPWKGLGPGIFTRSAHGENGCGTDRAATESGADGL